MEKLGAESIEQRLEDLGKTFKNDAQLSAENAGISLEQILAEERALRDDAENTGLPQLDAWYLDNDGVVSLTRFNFDASAAHAYVTGSKKTAALWCAAPEIAANTLLEAMSAKTPVDTLNGKAIRGFFAARGFEVELDRNDHMMNASLTDAEGRSCELELTSSLGPESARAFDDRTVLEVTLHSKSASEKLVTDILSPKG